MRLSLSAFDFFLKILAEFPPLTKIPESLKTVFVASTVHQLTSRLDSYSLANFTQAGQPIKLASDCPQKES